MRKSNYVMPITAFLMMVASLVPLKAGFEFSVFNPTGGGSAVLAPNALNAVDLWITGTGGEIMQSVDVSFRIGDGPGGSPEPTVSSVATTPGAGFFFDSRPTLPITPAGTGTSEVSFSGFLTPTSTLTGSQIIGRFFIDTTGFASTGPYTISLTSGVGIPSDVLDNLGNNYNATLSGGSFTVAAVPEPATLGLVGFGLVAVGARLRRRFASKALAA